MYFKRKQSNKSIAGHIWQSQGSITAGFCGFDLELCQQSEMCKAQNPATVIQGTNYKYQPLAWQSRTSCIIRVFFFFSSLTVAILVIKSKSLMEWVVFDFPEEADSQRPVCVLLTAVQTDGPYRSQGAEWLLSEWHSQTVQSSYSRLIRPSFSQS